MLSYDVLESFGKKYRLSPRFRNEDLPEMEQWAFFMFMIGQAAKDRYTINV